VSTELKGKPTVLQLGSYSCAVFRYRRFDIQALMHKYGDEVRFLVIYTQEAHPAGSKSPYRQSEWNPLINRIAGVYADQPADALSRLERARWTRSAIDHAGTFLVDTMDNAAWSSLGRAPSAAWVIDQHGTIQLAQPWVEPDGIARALEDLLTGIR